MISISDFISLCSPRRQAWLHCTPPYRLSSPRQVRERPRVERAQAVAEERQAHADGPDDHHGGDLPFPVIAPADDEGDQPADAAAEHERDDADDPQAGAAALEDQ